MTTMVSTLHDVYKEPELRVGDGRPLVWRLLMNTPRLSVTVLENGNLIMDYTPVSDWVRARRVSLCSLYMSAVASVDAFKAARRRELQQSAVYLRENIFTDHRENSELLVPGAVLAAGAFLVGTIVSNGRNWRGARSNGPAVQHLLGGLTTSFPSKVVTPLVLASVVLSQWVPTTWRNFVAVLQRDVLPQEFTAQWDSLYRRVYVEGVLQRSGQLRSLLQETLPELCGRYRRLLLERAGML
ncbi:Mic27p KNAG_0I01960 [Huiozyma naganishii CBS 8797]|uniref:Uncharacterized protein n=1 Tax=Huiozyma naganishii (strain ATCC MYA-139 / BCRC 22969 / CBS 8797 / KCTC 17520 / NBRC 10181 / NCYC 3082 / Yp74L-3) TaxID=1071383 RepID=J7SAA1_HUIN7|nr:hypothetical protein KNAG_0I01960 [Kazachstania naganishii CBS 8797]CCK71981.1 hypothetical protein KNAG_0I01960 [Kazachstania naganishii CBS 8797]